MLKFGKYIVLTLSFLFIVGLIGNAFAATQQEKKEAMTVLSEMLIGKHLCHLDNIPDEAIQDVLVYTSTIYELPMEEIAVVAVETAKNIYGIAASSSQERDLCKTIKQKADQTFGSNV